MNAHDKHITIVGSYMAALFLKSKEHPKLGETVICEEFRQSSGGKGSNQCVAAARLGAETKFVGCIGDDPYGVEALRIYSDEGIGTNGIIISKEKPTGIGVILINAKGQNIISVELGANLELSKRDIDNSETILKNSSIVGFQLENTIDVVEYGIKKCHELGVDVLLDPAPAQKLHDDIYPCLTYIKPNETEAEILTGIHVDDEESAFKAAKWFLARGVKNVLVTLGDKGVAYAGVDGETFFKASSDKPIDTTGAGDCFSGAFLAGVSTGKTIAKSIELAIIAAGISVTRLGVLESLPYLIELGE